MRDERIPTWSLLAYALLGEHPEVVVHHAYRYEKQAAGYWMHMLRVLTQPSDHAALDDRLTFSESTSSVGHHPAYSAGPETALELRDWFGRVHAVIRDFRHSLQRVLETWRKRQKLAHLLRYEDLVLRPVETLTRLLDYLAIDSAPAGVDGMIGRASESSDLGGHRTSRDGQNSIGRWRRELKLRLQAVCEEAFGDILRAFGYAGEEEAAEMSRA